MYLGVPAYAYICTCVYMDVYRKKLLLKTKKISSLVDILSISLLWTTYVPPQKKNPIC